MRLTKFIAAGFLALSLAGCASLGSGVSDVVISASTASPTQAKTVSEATLATSLAEQALDLYVQVGNPSPAVLRQLQILVPAVHNALKRVQQANTDGDNALVAGALAAFNESLAVLQSYETLKGIKH